MGVVYRGRGPGGVEVAIKLVTRGDARGAAMFDRERRLLALLGEAEGFVPILDSGTSPRGAFIVMAYLPGGTLRDRLHRGPLPAAEVAALGRTLGAALGAAHARGIVHRDLKPENVLFTAEGRPLIADLGLAKHWDREADGASQTVSISRDGSRLGTAGYMAPEQIADAKSAGPPADVFALGATLYECVTGVACFDGDTVVEILTKIHKGERKPIRSLVPGTPAALVRVIDRALATDTAARYADGAALARALDEGGDGEEGLSRGAKLLCGVAVASVAATAALASVAWPSRPGPSPVPVEVATVRSSGPVSKVPAPVASASASSRDPAAVIAAVSVHDAEVVRVLGGGGPHHGFLFASALVGSSRAVTASGDGLLVAWDLDARGARPVEIARLDVLSLADDGSIAIVRSTQVLVREVATGRSRPLPIAGDDASGAGISADGRRALVVRTEAIDLVDVETGRVLVTHELARTKKARHCIAPDGARFAYTRKDRVVVHDVASESAHELATDPSALVFSTDGRRILTSDHGEVSIHDAATGELLLRAASTAGRVSSIACCPDGERFVTTSTSGELVIHRLGDGGVVRRIAWPAGEAWGLGFSADGGRIIATAGDGTAGIVDVATGEVRVRLGERHAAIESLVALPGGSRLLAATTQGGVIEWELATGREIPLLEGRAGTLMQGAALAPDGSAALTERAPRTLWVVDLSSRREVLQIPARGMWNWVPAAALSAGARAIAVSTWDVPGVLVLDDSSQERGRLRFDSPPTALAFSARGDRLAIGASQGFLQVWDVASTTSVRLDAHREGRKWWPVAAVTFSPDGRRLFSGGTDRKAKVYDVESGEERWSIDGRSDSVDCIAWSPDGALVALGTRSGVRVVDADSGRHRAEVDVRGLFEGVTAVAFAATGRSMFIGLTGGEILEVELR